MVTRLQTEPNNEEFETEPTEETEDDIALPLEYEIASYPADYTLRVLNEQIRENQLVLPNFQRSYVWSAILASRLIESFLLGLPVPEVFLYKELATERRLIVDGQQRLATIAFFFRERFDDDRAFRLRGVDPRWDGKLYSELDERDRFRLDNSTLRSIVIQQLDPSDHSSMYLIFERLNTGGIHLNPMEIRRVQYSGTSYSFLEQLNMNDDWRGLIGMEKPQRRLRDVELVLRVLAFATSRDSYAKPLKTFLNDYMRELQEADETERAVLRRAFEDACRLARSHLGEKPFHIHRPLNVAALDSVLGVLTTERIPDGIALADRYNVLRNDAEFIGAIERATSDEESVKQRFARASAIILG